MAPRTWGRVGLGILLGLAMGVGPGVVPGWAGEDSLSGKTRKYFEYEGNYRETVDRLKADFKKAFGYELMDLDEGWRPDEIKRMHAAFAKLPENFYRLPKFRGFYRLHKLPGDNRNLAGGDIPAATFPKFLMVYRETFKGYRAEIQDEAFRIEFYDPMFYEDETAFNNIVHHEMGHVFDLTHGFLSLQADWLKLAGFRTLNLPPLDAKPGTDFLFTFVDEPSRLGYAPVSNRHLPTYSRESPQEDFANSVAGYLHYPYFQYSHPHRYGFMKEVVFKGWEKFPAQDAGVEFTAKVREDAAAILAKRDWEGLFRIAVEVGRDLRPDAEREVLQALNAALVDAPGPEAAAWVAKATCYLFDPDGLVLRRRLVNEGRVKASTILKNEHCRRLGKDFFERRQTRWPVMKLHFYRENGSGKIKFLDPVALNARARGFTTRYRWRMVFPQRDNEFVALGEAAAPAAPTGSVSLDLKSTAAGRFHLPTDIVLQFEIAAERWDEARNVRFTSERNVIQFVVKPWFDYAGPEPLKPQIHYPMRLLPLNPEAAH